MDPLPDRAHARYNSTLEAVLEVEEPAPAKGAEHVFVRRGIEALVDERQALVRQVGHTCGDLRTDAGNGVTGHQVEIV